MKKVFLQYNQLAHLPESYQDRLWDIADFHQQLPYDHDFICQKTDDLDQAFEELLDINPDWVVVVSLGHCSQNRSLYDECIQSAVDMNVPLLGHLMNFPDQYPHLHPQLFVVDYQVWRECGYPKWNYSGEPCTFTSLEYFASKETFHDDYTPYRIRSTENSKKYSVTEMQVGAQVIRAFIENLHTVHNILDPQRQTKFHLYPDQDWEAFNDFLNGQEYTGNQSSQKEYCSLIEHLNSQVRKQYYVLNTEALTNIPAGTKIDHYAGVSSGLKLFCTMVKNGFDASTGVTFFDFSPVALQFQKAMIKNWNGDFESYQMHCKRFEYATPGHYPCLPSGPWEDTYLHVLNELNITADDFKYQWQLFTKLDIGFELINLYDARDQQKLADICGQFDQNYLWISNAFNMEYSLIKLGKEWLKLAYMGFADKLITCGKSVILDSNDFVNNGLITFNKQVAESPSS